VSFIHVASAMKNLRLVGVCVAVTAALVLCGCGDDDDSGPAASGGSSAGANSAAGAAKGGDAASAGKTSSGGNGAGAPPTGAGLTCPSIDGGGPPADCSSYCVDALANCGAASQSEGKVSDMDTCLSFCKTFTVTQLCCRAAHVKYAPSDLIHCQHAVGINQC
jgi:hypothetical protein